MLVLYAILTLHSTRIFCFLPCRFSSCKCRGGYVDPTLLGAAGDRGCSASHSPRLRLESETLMIIDCSLSGREAEQPPSPEAPTRLGYAKRLCSCLLHSRQLKRHGRKQTIVVLCSTNNVYMADIWRSPFHCINTSSPNCKRTKINAEHWRLNAGKPITAINNNNKKQFPFHTCRDIYMPRHHSS
eukprot:jgi/Botrbrau1/3100/Bobra.0070s0084.1